MLLAIFGYDKPLESVFNPFNFHLDLGGGFILSRLDTPPVGSRVDCGGRTMHFVWSLIGKVNASQMHLA